MRKRSLVSLTATALLSGLVTVPALAASELTVYTAVEAEDLKTYAAAFKAV